MALPNSGGGYQFTDGNTNEIIMGVQAAPQTATATATLTAAQITGGLLVATAGTGAVSYTMPTAAAIDAVFVNAKVNSTFELKVVNLGTSSGIDAPQRIDVAKIEMRGGVHGASKASSMALNFRSVSANSFSGVDPATMPAPANTRAAPPSTTAERIPTKNSPPPRAFSQPSAPA